MAKYPRMDDLLRTSRRRSRRRGRGSRQFIFVALLLGLGACAWWWFSRPDPAEQKRATELNLIADASTIVARSVVAARAPLHIEQAAPDAERDHSAQLAAVWTEGQAVSMRGTLEKNQSIAGVLGERNLSPQAIHAVVAATREEFNFRKSRPGDKWFVQTNKDGEVELFRYQTSPEDIWETTRNSDGTYRCEKRDIPVQTRQEVLAGVIQSSLWQAIADQGEDGSLIYNFTDMFAYTIDFNANTHPGDRFALVFEKIYLDQKFLRYGRVLGGIYAGAERAHYGFLHETGDDEFGYYDDTGDNLKRQFLKSPLASVRITSTYGKRFHPILNKTKAHNGIDYGAPIGTEIHAVADGTVRVAGRQGAAGIMISIDHANQYQTIYMHLSKIDKGVRPGARVKKKQIIGRTGNTGRSTGPHLHFGMKHKGQYIDPRKVDAARGEPLRGKARDEFVREVADPLKKKLHEALKKVGGTPFVAAMPDERPAIQAH